MVERFGVLGSQALALGALWLCGLLYSRILKRTLKQIRSGDDGVAWVKTNPIKHHFLIIPTFIAFAPAAEELLWRAPLIAAFDALEGPRAWGFVIASSIGFGLAHFDETIPLVSKIYDIPMRKETMLLVRITRAIFAAVFGCILAYFGITHQSLLLAFGLHAAWNAAHWIGIQQNAVVILMIIGILPIRLALVVWDRLNAMWWSVWYGIDDLRWRLTERLAGRRDVEDDPEP